MKTDEEYMAMAYQEACRSHQEGNHGFGAVIVDPADTVLAASHDTEVTGHDATLHAELTAIRKASGMRGRDLGGCTLFSTHEPCPMCSTAIYWSGIRTIVFSVSIRESMEEGRKRLDIGCREIFERAGCAATIREGVLHDACRHLYAADVRQEIKKLRNKDTAALEEMGTALREKRIRWARDHRREFDSRNPLESGYRLLLAKLDVDPCNAPVVRRDDRSIVFHSKNHCPTLEACTILGLDTRVVCRHLLEQATDGFLKELDPRLRFERNYDALRPSREYCEEMIHIE